MREGFAGAAAVAEQLRQPLAQRDVVRPGPQRRLERGHEAGVVRPTGQRPGVPHGASKRVEVRDLAIVFLFQPSLQVLGRRAPVHGEGDLRQGPPGRAEVSQRLAPDGLRVLLHPLEVQQQEPVGREAPGPARQVAAVAAIGEHLAERRRGARDARGLARLGLVPDLGPGAADRLADRTDQFQVREHGRAQGDAAVVHGQRSGRFVAQQGT